MAWRSCSSINKDQSCQRSRAIAPSDDDPKSGIDITLRKRARDRPLPSENNATLGFSLVSAPNNRPAGCILFNPLDNGGQPLADADAERYQRIAAIDALQLAQRR